MRPVLEGFRHCMRSVPWLAAHPIRHLDDEGTLRYCCGMCHSVLSVLLQPTPTGLENMPEFGKSLPCAGAPYLYQGEEKLSVVSLLAGYFLTPETVSPASLCLNSPNSLVFRPCLTTF